MKKTINHIQRKIYIVNNFKIQIFIKIDIFESKCIRIDINDQKLFIKNCDNLIVDINIKIKNNIDVYRAIRNQKKIIILSNSFFKIFVKMRISLLLLNKNYFFKFNLIKIYVYIVDVHISFVYIKNNIKSKKIIFRYFNLNIVVKYNVDSYYIIHFKYYLYIIKKNDIKINKSKNVLNIKLFNDICIFNDEKQIVKLKILINKYDNI